jgi:hypothetical protein
VRPLCRILSLVPAAWTLVSSFDPVPGTFFSWRIVMVMAAKGTIEPK